MREIAGKREALPAERSAQAVGGRGEAGADRRAVCREGRIAAALVAAGADRDGDGALAAAARGGEAIAGLGETAADMAEQSGLARIGGDRREEADALRLLAVDLHLGLGNRLGGHGGRGKDHRCRKRGTSDPCEKPLIRHPAKLILLYKRPYHRPRVVATRDLVKSWTCCKESTESLLFLPPMPFPSRKSPRCNPLSALRARRVRPRMYPERRPRAFSPRPCRDLSARTESARTRRSSRPIAPKQTLLV